MGACSSTPVVAADCHVTVVDTLSSPGDGKDNALSFSKVNQNGTVVRNLAADGFAPVASARAGLPDEPSECGPLTLDQAPAGVRLRNLPAHLYAAPYIPPPSVLVAERLDAAPGTPEAMHAASAAEWRPSRRRALLVGVNYGNAPGLALRGCITDVHCLLDMLLTFRFQESDVVLLHDDQPHAGYLPTKANILAAARRLAVESQPNDSLFFAFSGHGASAAQPAAQGKAAADGACAGLLPCDYAEAGPISMADLHDTIFVHLADGARMLCVVDAVDEKASMSLPIPILAKQNGWAAWKEPAAAADVFSSACTDGASDGPPTPSWDGASSSAAASSWESSGRKALSLDQRPVSRDVTLVAARHDREHAGDDEDFLVSARRQPSTGAASFALLQAVRQGQSSTYNVLLRAMRLSLKNGPQHFCSHLVVSSLKVFSLNRPFQL